jgi:hypothetical protein
VPHGFGAGDATTVPYKQGGLAAQQGALAARAIARTAGVEVADVEPHPTLRARTGSGLGATWFATPVLASDERAAVVAHTPLWRSPTKVSMPYLATYLERVEARIAD